MYLLAQAQQGIESIIPSLFMFGLIGLGFYFMILKPQKKQQEQMKQTMDSLKVGDHVITRAGVRGVVVQLKGDSFILETSPQRTQIEYLKQAISYVEASDANFANNPFENQTVGDLSYGNDSRFINAIAAAKEVYSSDKEIDLLLEDVYEFVVLENVKDTSEIQRTFRLDSERARKIVNELVELKLLNLNEQAEIEVLLDPRN